MRLPKRRIVVGLVALAVVAGALAALIFRAGRSAPDLPRISPASLVASMVRALGQGRPVSGSAELSVDLGLPQILDIGSQGGALSLLSGFHDLRVWRSADGFRISDLEPTGERALFVSRGHAWAWDFDSLTAYDLGGLPSPTGSVLGLLDSGGSPVVIHRGLTAISETTSVSVSGSTSIAGRPAYRLVVAPKQAETLVGAIEIDVDARTRLPLALSVFSRDRKEAAISLGFTSVSFGPIDHSVFEFHPPPGARVQRAGLQGTGLDLLLALARSVRTFGRAWTSVLAVRVPSVEAGGLSGALASGLLQFQGALVSVHVADRGDHSWVMVGAVPLTRLVALDSRLP